LSRVLKNKRMKLYVGKCATTSRFVRIILRHDDGNVVAVADTLQPPPRKPRPTKTNKRNQYRLHLRASKDS
jgi:hypothetical protein